MSRIRQGTNYHQLKAFERGQIMGRSRSDSDLGNGQPYKPYPASKCWTRWFEESVHERRR